MNISLRRLLGLSSLGLLALAPLAAFASQGEGEIVHTESRTTAVGERIRVHTLELEAPVQKVWDACTTSEGWQAWSAPKVELDLRVGGQIRTHYDTSAKLGDEGTIYLEVLAYVPLELLTLRAEVSSNWPEIMKKDADRLSNVMLFQELGPERTRLISYGIGYGDAPEYEDLLEFFRAANVQLYRGLKRYVENDEDEAR